jgi:hypothetical protein
MIRKLIREIKTHRVVRKIFKDKDNLARLHELGFDIDWVGRIYGVIAVDTEILYLPERNWQEQYDKMAAVDTYIKDKLVRLVKFFNELQISNLLIYPEQYEQFDGTNDFLVVLEPEHSFYSPKRLVVFLCILGGLVLGAGITALILV